MREPFLILHLLILFGALQALFLAVILWGRKATTAKRLFACFLLIEGLTLFERLLAETGYMTQWPHVLGISYPLNFAKPPILYFAALAMIDPRFHLGRKHLLHGMVFLLMVLINVPFYTLSGAEKVAQVSAFIDYVPAYDSFNFWFFLSFFAFIGAYLVASIRALRDYRQHIKVNKVANGYLSVLYVYTGLLTLSLLHFVLRPTGWVEFSFVNEASMLSMTFLIQSIAYSLLSNSTILEERVMPFARDVDQLTSDSERLIQSMEVGQAYVDDALTLEGFAAIVGLSKKRVSEVVNQKMGVSFKEWVNHYRINHVTRAMSEGPVDSLTALGLEAGFNNKVTFYRTFKKHTGKSPSQYFEDMGGKK